MHSPRASRPFSLRPNNPDRDIANGLAGEARLVLENYRQGRASSHKTTPPLIRVSRGEVPILCPTPAESAQMPPRQPERFAQPFVDLGTDPPAIPPTSKVKGKILREEPRALPSDRGPWVTGAQTWFYIFQGKPQLPEKLDANCVCRFYMLANIRPNRVPIQADQITSSRNCGVALTS